PEPRRRQGRVTAHWQPSVRERAAHALGGLSRPGGSRVDRQIDFVGLWAGSAADDLVDERRAHMMASKSLAIRRVLRMSGVGLVALVGFTAVRLSSPSAGFFP